MSQVRPPGAKKTTFLGKTWEKTKQDPLVPIGTFLTAGVLFGGLWTLKTGQAALSQKFMRARVLAQGATVACICAGGFLLGSADPANKLKKETYEDKLLELRAERRALLQESPAAVTPAPASSTTSKADIMARLSKTPDGKKPVTEKEK